MATADVGFVAVSRAVVAAPAGLAAEVERRVVGDENVRTAQGNAWAAICADRARAQARAEMEAMVAALAAWPADARTARDQAAPTPVTRGRAAPHKTAQARNEQHKATQRRNAPGQHGQAQNGQAQNGQAQNGQAQSRRTRARRGGQRAVGSSPRSSASQAALVSTR